jgi:hypothetical protein
VFGTTDVGNSLLVVRQEGQFAAAHATSNIATRSIPGSDSLWLSLSAVSTMVFFGMTSLGPSDPIQDQLAASQAYEFHNIKQEAWQRCWEKYLLRDSHVATTLEVDGFSHILRASLGDMLREVRSRKASLLLGTKDGLSKLKKF